jgi:predicted nucleic acid-binding Zn ribbon protein
MKTIGTILRNYFKDLGIEKPIHRYQAIDIWPEVVGIKISEVTKAQRISNDTLFVKVKNDTWRYEIEYHKQEIMQKLNNRLGEEIINDIIFI